MAIQDINSVVIIGRLTSTPELKYLNSGSAVISFSIAINSGKKTDSGYENEVSFFECEIFGKIAESVHPFMTKGKQVAVAGRLKQQRWMKEGKNYSKVVIMVDNLQLLGGKNESEAPQDNGTTVTDAIKKQNERKADYKPIPPGMPKLSAISESEEFTEEIPF